MTYLEAVKALKKGPYAPLYTIWGEEPYFIEQLLKIFEAKIDPTIRDFNYDRFDGQETTANQLVSVAQMLPVMSENRLIIVRNTHLIKDPPEAFLPYLDRPLESTMLVFVIPKADTKKKLPAFLKEKGVAIECRPLYENQARGWILREAKERGLHFTEEAITFLCEHLGTNLYLIQQELDKIALRIIPPLTGVAPPAGVAPPEGSVTPARRASHAMAATPAGAVGDEISLELCQQTLGSGQWHSIFTLTNEIAEKNLKEALTLLAALHSEGEPPLLILAMILRQWQMMAIAKESVEAGLSPAAISEKLAGHNFRLPPSLREKFLHRLSYWKNSEIQAGIVLALSANSALKGSGISSLFILEAMLLDVMRKGTGYTPAFLR